ncbi:hypothetical protein C8R44DRAFT_735356 [Mycena epipterygia]|nr:hypothetical protein C8R44DRAFT_735356 [Mycena epipterygia]
MCNTIPTPQTSIVAGTQSLVSGTTFGYICLALACASLALYVARYYLPSKKLARLEDTIKVAEGDLKRAKEDCARDHVDLLDVERRFLQATVSVSEIQSQVLDAGKLSSFFEWNVTPDGGLSAGSARIVGCYRFVKKYLQTVRGITKSISKCSKEIEMIQTAMLRIIEEERRRKVFEAMEEVREREAIAVLRSLTLGLSLFKSFVCKVSLVPYNSTLPYSMSLYPMDDQMYYYMGYTKLPAPHLAFPRPLPFLHPLHAEALDCRLREEDELRVHGSERRSEEREERCTGVRKGEGVYGWMKERTHRAITTTSYGSTLRPPSVCTGTLNAMSDAKVYEVNASVAKKLRKNLWLHAPTHWPIPDKGGGDEGEGEVAAGRVMQEGRTAESPGVGRQNVTMRAYQRYRSSNGAVVGGRWPRGMQASLPLRREDPRHGGGLGVMVSPFVCESGKGIVVLGTYAAGGAAGPPMRPTSMFTSAG